MYVFHVFLNLQNVTDFHFFEISRNGHEMALELVSKADCWWKMISPTSPIFLDRIQLILTKPEIGVVGSGLSMKTNVPEYQQATGPLE